MRTLKITALVGSVVVVAVLLVALVVGLLAGTSALAPALESDDSGSGVAREADEDFGSVEVYAVLDDGSLEPAATGLAQLVWETFTRVTTLEGAAAAVVEYRVGDAPDSDTLAYVYQSDDPNKWVLAANLATSDDPGQLVATLIHEYAHILTLGVGQLDPNAASCDTLRLDEGCADGSVLAAFNEQFWTSYGDAAPTADNSDADVAWSFYLEHEDDFVSDYAATNVVEDVAESFMTWVIEDSTSGASLVAEKLAFFEGYPSLVGVRDRLRAEFAGDLGLTN